MLMAIATGHAVALMILSIIHAYRTSAELNAMLTQTAHALMTDA